MATTGVFEPQKFEIGRVLSTTFTTIGRNFPLYFGIAFITSGVPQMLFQYLLGTTTAQRTVLTNTTGATTITTSTGAFASSGAPGFLLIYSIAMIALTGLLYASLTRATIEDLSGKRPTVGECLSTGLSLLLPAVGISLLVGFASVIGVVFLVVPGVIIWLGWCVAIPVLVQEREGVLGSMSRSWDLTKGNKWSLFGLFLIVGVIIWIVLIVFSMLGALALPALGAAPFAIVQGLGTALYSIVLVTVAAASYIELRRAKEGTGVDELAEIFA